jgi:ferredoxin
MGMFVSIKIDLKACPAGCRKCADVCPVNIFKVETQGPVQVLTVVEDNEDECTFCNLCLDKCAPGAIKIIKNY